LAVDEPATNSQRTPARAATLGRACSKYVSIYVRNRPKQRRERERERERKREGEIGWY